jgi:hypothetical protein
MEDLDKGLLDTNSQIKRKRKATVIKNPSHLHVVARNEEKSLENMIL